MAVFSYVARDQEGNQRLGTIEGRDLSEARENVRERDLYVVTIQKRTDPGKQTSLFRKKKVKLGDLVVMSRQLATLFRSGISLLDCLYAAARQSESPLLSEALEGVRIAVMGGSTLTDGMKLFPEVFNIKFIALAQAGEAGGVLDQTLEIAADQFDREAELQEKIKAAAVYPVIVICACIGVVIFMLVFIVPVFADVYAQFHAELPPLTRMLITLSHVLVSYWWIITGIIVAVAQVWKRFIRTPYGMRFFHRMQLKLPLLGKLNRKVAVARFTETFSGAVTAGIPILQGLSVSGQTTGNVIIMDAIDRAAAQVQDGAPLAPSLEQSGEFPPMITYMIAAGEQSGNLDIMLAEITRFYSRDIEYAVSRLTRAMEPLMTILIGIIVLFILLALYMPVFNMTQVIQK
jgi:type II secretory pathway component PulF